MEEIEYLEEYEEIVMPQLLHNAIGEFLPPDDPYDLVDPAFDEFIEEDPISSVYRSTTTLSSSNTTNSIVTANTNNIDDGDGSTILTDDISQDNMIIEQSETTTTSPLIGVHNINHQLEYVPKETTLSDKKEQNKDNIDNIETISELQNNSDNNIIYDTNYIATSPDIIDHDFKDSGVKVLSCETLGTSAFLNATSTISTQQQKNLTTPIKETTDNQITAAGNSLLGIKSDYFRATHSSNKKKFPVLGLSISPPTIQLSLSESQQNVQKIHQQLQNNSSSLRPKMQSLQQEKLATKTSNWSRKLSIIYKNSDLYPQLVATKCGLRSQNSSEKFKSFYLNKISDNIKRFSKLKKCLTNKSHYRLHSTENNIVAVHASSFNRTSFLFRSKETSMLKYSSIGGDGNNEETKIVAKYPLKQYQEEQKLQDEQIFDDSQDSNKNLTNAQELNYDKSTNQNDKKYLQEISTNNRHLKYNIPLKDSAIKPAHSDMISVSKRNCNNKNIKDADLILAKNTSLKTHQRKSLISLRNADFNNDSSGNKFRNIMISKFPKPLRNKQTKTDDNKFKATSVGGYKELKKKTNCITDSLIDNNKPKLSTLNNLDEKDLSSTSKKSHTSNDVLNSPKQLRVVMSRTPELESPKDIHKLTDNLNNIEDSIILDLTDSKDDEEEQDRLVDTGDVDPLQLDEEKLISQFQLIDESKSKQLEKLKNEKIYEKRTAPINDFELFACQQKLKNYVNANNMYLKFCKSESETPKLVLHSINIKSNTATKCDKNLNNKSIKNIDSLNENEINNCNETKTIKHDENLAEKADKSMKKNNKNINNKLKTIENIQDNSITSNENGNTENILKNTETETNKSDTIIVQNSSNEEILSKTGSVEETMSPCMSPCNQSSNGSSSSNIQEVSQLAIRSRDRNSCNSDQSPALDIQTGIITESKESVPISGSSETRQRRTVQRRSTGTKIECNKNIVVECNNSTSTETEATVKETGDVNHHNLSKMDEVLPLREKVIEKTIKVKNNIHLNSNKIEMYKMATKKKEKNTKNNMNDGKKNSKYNLNEGKQDTLPNKNEQETVKDEKNNEKVKKETMNFNKDKILSIQESNKSASKNQSPIKTSLENVIIVKDTHRLQTQSKPNIDKDKVLKASKRQNRELKLLEINDNSPRIFVESTSNTRLSRSLSKRSPDVNSIKISRQKTAAKIIRRRQSNIIQISRKEYDRVVSERIAKQQIADSPPISEGNNVHQENTFSQNEEKKIKKNIKPCKVVLERLQVFREKGNISKASQKLFFNSKFRENNEHFVKESILNSSQKMNVDSDAVSSATKKRKINSNDKEFIELKLIKKSVDNNSTLSTTIGTITANADEKMKNIAQKSDDTEKKRDITNKDNNCKSDYLNTRILTKNLNLLNDNKNIQKNDKTKAIRQLESSLLVDSSGLKEVNNSPNSLSEMESITKCRLNSKRKHSGPAQTIDDNIKVQKFSSPEISNLEKSKDLNEIDLTSSRTSTKSVVQGKINSKPQIFIAAPGNVSRRNNFDSNLRENNSKDNNNSTINNNLDFSIESWFKNVPTSSSDQMETFTKNSTHQNENILENVALRTTSISSSIQTAPTTSVQLTNSQCGGTTNTYWPLTSSSPTHTQITSSNLKTTFTQSPQIASTSNILSFPMTTLASTYPSNIKPINIPAHIVVQTKFLTREQYISKFKNSPSTNLNLTASPSNILSPPSNISSPPTNNNLVSCNSKSGIIDNKNVNEKNSAKILEKISNLLETQIDSEIIRKMQNLIENKAVEDQLRTERLTNIKKFGYASDFSLQVLVFLQNYFFNKPTVNMKDIYNTFDEGSGVARTAEKQITTATPNIISPNEDFAFRKIRLPVQNKNINNNDTNKNKLQKNLPNRTTLNSSLNKNMIVGVYKKKYPVIGSGAIIMEPNDRSLVNIDQVVNIRSSSKYNKSISPAKIISSDVFQSDTNLPQIAPNMSSDTLKDIMKMPSLLLRQTSSSEQRGQINTDVFLNSASNTCEAGITNEPESILPDDNTIIAPPLLETEIKEEDQDVEILY